MGQVRLTQSRCEVLGAGGVTILHGDHQEHYPAGERFPLAALGMYRAPLGRGTIPQAIWRCTAERAEAARLLRQSLPRPDGKVRNLLEERADARRRKDWAEADRLSQQIEALGWHVRDTPDGSRLEPTAVESNA